MFCIDELAQILKSGSIMIWMKLTVIAFTRLFDAVVALAIAVIIWGFSCTKTSVDIQTEVFMTTYLVKVEG